jgi:hypothetical protein
VIAGAHRLFSDVALAREAHTLSEPGTGGKRRQKTGTIAPGAREPAREAAPGGDR